MRLRNVPGAREVMVENEYVFTEPEGMCGVRDGRRNQGRAGNDYRSVSE